VLKALLAVSITVLVTQAAVIATSVYLHRGLAHRALTLHPLADFFFRIVRQPHRAIAAEFVKEEIVRLIDEDGGLFRIHLIGGLIRETLGGLFTNPRQRIERGFHSRRVVERL